MVKDVPFPNVVAGQRYTITLSVENIGPDEAVGVTIADGLPDQLVFRASQDCVHLEADALVSCPLGNIALGTTASASYTVQVVDAPQVSLPYVFESVATTSGLTVDPDGLSNRVVVSQTILASQPTDVTVSLPSGSFNLAVGDVIPFPLQVENVGSAPAYGVVATWTVPDAVEFTASDSGSCLSEDPNLLVCRYDFIDVGLLILDNVSFQAVGAASNVQMPVVVQTASGDLVAVNDS
ncbi:MAG: hypothetical protein AAF125_11605, partial [Chloroflexota bacterium]